MIDLSSLADVRQTWALSGLWKHRALLARTATLLFSRSSPHTSSVNKGLDDFK
jgi:hypothetical protein